MVSPPLIPLGKGCPVSRLFFTPRPFSLQTSPLLVWLASGLMRTAPLAVFLFLSPGAYSQTGNSENICRERNALNSAGTVCDLSHQGVTSLSSGDFNGLSKLQKLYLNDNNLSSLPEDIFNNLSELQDIRLHNNKLSSLPEDIFDGLSNLQLLYLSGNGLSSLPEDIFDRLSSLIIIDLRDNNLSSLSADIFAGLSNLQHLYLSNNDLSSLPADIFNELFTLRHLYLWDNNLSSLPADIFNHLCSLKTIILGKNKLSNLPRDIFNCFSSIENIDLGVNNLSSLSEDIFDGLSNLRYLALGDNDLSSLPADVFDGLSKLQSLRLNDNELSSLPEDIFDDPKLKNLYLRNNKLSCLPRKLSLPQSVRIDVRLPWCGVPIITVTGGSGGREGANTVFTIQASQAPTANLSVALEVRESSGDGQDFVAPDNEGLKTVTIPSGQLSATYTVSTVDDSTDEVNGMVTVALQDSTAREYSAGQSASISVEDDDATVVSLERVGSGDLTEGEKTEFNLTLSRALVAGEIIDAPLSIGGDSGVSTADWRLSKKAGDNLNTGVALLATATSTPQVRFSGAGARRAMLELTAVDDDETEEGGEIIIVALGLDGLETNGFDDPSLATNVGGGADPHQTQKSFSFTVRDRPIQNICERLEAWNDNDKTKCNLSGRGIPSLRSADFEGLSSLQELYLHNNQLSSLPEDVFKNLSSLQTLYLKGNDLSNLPEGVFRGLSNLTRIDLSSNDLSSLPEGVFRELSNLTDIDLSHNHLSSLPKDVFNRLSNLTRILLHDNNLSSLPKDVFRGLPNVTSILLSHNNLSSLPEGIFHRLPNLRFLHLIGNNLSCLPRSLSSRVTVDVTLPWCGVPVITITAGSDVSEGDNAVFTVQASQAPTANLSVNLTVGETSGDGQDLVAPDNQGAKTVTIPSGQSSATYTVSTVDDSTDQGNRMVTVALQDSTAREYSTGQSATASITVEDNDATVVSLARLGSGGLTEGDTVEFILTLGRALVAGESIDVPLSIGGDSGVSTADWRLLKKAGDNLNTGVTLSAITTATPQMRFSGAGARRATLQLTVVDDGTTESGESITVALGPDGSETNGFDHLSLTTNVGGGADPHRTQNSFSVTVADLAAQRLVLSQATLAVEEGESGSYTVKLATQPSGDVTVTVRGTADTDLILDTHEKTGNQETLTFTPSNWDSGQTVKVTAAQDTDSLNDHVTLNHVAAGGDYTGAQPSVAVTVNDDDTLLISVTDAAVQEAEGAELVFKVRLNKALTDSSSTVKVNYATRNGTATAGNDYVATADTLSFAAGDTEKTVKVVVLDDSHDEASETMNLVLSLAADSQQQDGVRFVNPVGTGTITNSDPMPRAWLTRFGRTVSQQVVDVLQDRFSTRPSAPGLALAVAGEELTDAGPLAENQQVLSKLLGFEKVGAPQLVEGSSFSFSPQATATAAGGAGGPGRFSLWGQGALASFRGEEDSVSLEGDVSTALVAAEWRTERWQAGAALSHSWGSGSYQGEVGNNSGDGEISATLTGLFPYGRYGLTPRLGIWAVAGTGWGELSLQPLQPDGEGREYQPDTRLGMAAVGMDGLLMDGGAEGLSLNATADVLTLTTTSEAVKELASSEGAVSRLRLGLEAVRPFPLSGGASLLPSLEIGLRQDSGDGETGFGLELGAGLSWSDAARGISGALQGRTLLTHTDEEFREEGVSFSLGWDPSSGNRGVSLSVSQAWGAVASGGMDGLLSPTVLEAVDDTRTGGQEQFEAKLAYGFPAFGEGLTVSPGLGVVLSSDRRKYSLLWALSPYGEQGQADASWETALEGEREERSSAPTSVGHSLGLRFSLLF